ncbi:alpha-hydroxy acid oxidase [soil metagenome]
MDHRRAFLRFLAASPLLAGSAFAQSPANELVTKAQDGLDVFDFEAVAKKAIPPAHWGYLMTGVDGEETLKANREAFSLYQLRTRRLVDVSRLDMGVTLFGDRFNSPIFLSPLGAQRAFHADAELGTARAAKAKGQLQILSTVTSTSVEEVAKARGGPLWFQLYTTDNLDVAMKLVRRAEAAGCRAVAVTVDLPAGRNTETVVRLSRTDTRTCTACHTPGGSPMWSRPMFTDVEGAAGLKNSSAALTWDFVKRLRDGTKMKILIKGLESGEDATLAIKAGVDGIVVSNHGGRATETGRGTLECLPEVVAAVKGRIPVLFDGGVRRGTDALKALALGATAVGIGRPYIWGLGAFGQPGVERVLDVLHNELRLAMAGVGANTLRDLTPAALIKRA